MLTDHQCEANKMRRWLRTSEVYDISFYADFKSKKTMPHTKEASNFRGQSNFLLDVGDIVQSFQ